MAEITTLLRRVTAGDGEANEPIDERAFRVVEMRYFAGMTEEDIASVLDVSVATVRRDWRKARAFLYERLR